MILTASLALEIIMTMGKLLSTEEIVRTSVVN